MINSSFKNANLLIVDDNSSNIELLHDMLELTGYRNVKSTTDPREVIDLYASFQPDLILLDLMMPHMNGFEVMDKLKELVSPKTYLPILVLTADNSTEVRQKALSCGANDFLSKPFDLNEVSLRIKNLLETRYLYQLIEKQNISLALKVKERTSELEKVNKELIVVNQELEVLDKAKLEFLNIISHEIRTPLNGIKGFAGILKSGIDSPELLEYLNHLEVSADRLQQFALQALLITELRTSMYQLDIQELSILELVEQTKMNLKTKIDKKNIQIELQNDVDICTVKADVRLIQICFERLIDNAINNSPENNIVLVNAYSENKRTVIEFIDNGVGFSPVALKSLFRLFAMGQKHIDNNIGLNLAMIKLIMDAHNGTIKVSNNKPKGAIVALTFTAQNS